MMIHTMDLRYLFCIIALFCIYLSKSEDFPPRLYTCSKNCTVLRHLQCWITTTNNDCEPTENQAAFWPGPPKNFNWTLKYRIIKNRCVGSPELYWSIPEDSSALSLKGFQLTLIVLNGMYENYRVCVTFNLTKAIWTENDIYRRIWYSYDCILLSPGSYYASLYSLPMSARDQQTKLYLYIPEARIEKGQQCVPVTKVISPAPKAPNLTTVQSSHTQAITSSIGSHGNWLKWCACGIGVACGLAVIILIVAVIRKYKTSHPQQSQSGDGMMDDQEYLHDRDHYFAGVVPPMEPDEIGSDISAAIDMIVN